MRSAAQLIYVSPNQGESQEAWAHMGPHLSDVDIHIESLRIPDFVISNPRNIWCFVFHPAV